METDKQRRILVIMSDEMVECAAYRRAIKLAEMSGSSLHLCMFAYHPALENLRGRHPAVAEEAINAHVASRREWLGQRSAALWNDGVEAVAQVEWTRLRANSILAKVADLKPDLVIKEIQAESALRRAFFTPLDWELLRLCPAQLMLVRSTAPARPRHIIAAVDVMDTHDKPSGLNDAIVGTAARLAADFHAELDLLHVFQFLPMAADIPAAGPMATDLWARLHDEMRQQQRDAFTRFADRHGVAAARRHFLEQPVIEGAIEDYAVQHHADVLVLGTSYQTGVDRFLIGSTAERLLTLAPCDLLAVKTEAFQKILRQQRSKH